MNRNMLLMLGGGAILLWYLNNQKPATAVPSAAAGTHPATPATPAAQPAAPVGSSLKSKIEAAIVAGGNSNTYIYGQQSPDTWNWHAMQAFPGWAAPSPEDLYPGVPDVHGKAVTFGDWFGRLQPFLASAGLSGFVPRSPLFNRLYGGWMA